MSRESERDFNESFVIQSRVIKTRIGKESPFKDWIKSFSTQNDINEEDCKQSSTTDSVTSPYRFIMKELHDQLLLSQFVKQFECSTRENLNESEIDLAIFHRQHYLLSHSDYLLLILVSLAFCLMSGHEYLTHEKIEGLTVDKYNIFLMKCGR